jgi:DNA topoisomerase IA
MAFVPEEYWTLEAELQRRTDGNARFRARLFKINGEDPARAASGCGRRS